MKKILLQTGIILFLLLHGFLPKVAAIRFTPLYPVGNSISLNGIWKFKYIPSSMIGPDSMFYPEGFEVSKWDHIKVPGHWELQGFAEPKYKSVDEGTGLYRTTFTVPESFRERQVFIRFEGVQYAYEVYVNGQKAGEWSSSYNAASFNITDLVQPGKENTLAVRVSTRSKGYQFDLNDCWALSGIFRDVTLFSTPDLHIDDFTVQTFLNNDRSANIRIAVKLQDEKKEISGSYVLKAILNSPEGKVVQEKSWVAQTENSAELTVNFPELWTAETPALYSLALSLLKDGNEIQRVNQKVGIREVKIDGTVLKLNGKALKLRGVDHHDLVPETGRTLSREQILNDLLLMKRANINFVRTSHYPSDRRTLDVCDSLGFYVICEVPFGFGNSFLEDSSYQNILLTRAKATLLRDKNHPSVILWSLGNENPVTPITNITAQYVKTTDPTRPVCYPQMGSYFNENYQNIPDYMDVYAPHYRDAEWVKSFAKETNRPVIMTEYAHALGLAFGNMASIWKEMFRNEAFAGGAVWHFHDQGILRKAEKPVDTSQLAYDVWIDSLNYYNTTLDGADGIVYADRTPQTDYWQVRKVYSPVQVIEKEINVVQGKQEVNVTVYNQYDFTNLNTLSGTWELFRNREVIQQGGLKINCAPHDTVRVSIPCTIAENPENAVWLLRLRFSDPDRIPVFEHTIRLSTENQMEAIFKAIREGLPVKHVKISGEDNETILKTKDFICTIHDGTMPVSLVSRKRKAELLNSEIYVRTGRIPQMADVTVRDRFFPETGDYYWEPHLLKSSRTAVSETKNTTDEYQVLANKTFRRGENFPGQKIEAGFLYTLKNNGILELNYNLSPENCTGFFLEAGVSLILPATTDQFLWLGDGPYVSYPEKNELNDFGIHQIHKEDLNFKGNRTNVEIAVLTDRKGNGLALLGDQKNISVELRNNQVVVSHNSIVSGVGNKKNMPTPVFPANDISSISGKLEIIPLVEGRWPEKLKEIFGAEIKPVIPFKPFYYSYDTSY
ncbi:glycoside hydrolase family 2 TIM barrel-domain containing protein [Gaoshiqia sp. Z1-71]|uniref:glycoside hydrolase family 2 TIM barrel-domain containing protein n=1 Tax=Gaoshiqia hydrogeniformans TaxID=3290090 RepID=UPI003BF79666